MNIFLLQAIIITKVSNDIKYIGNPTSVNDHACAASRLVDIARNAVMYIVVDSVSGCFQTLMIVGMAAKRSLTIANIVAIYGSSVYRQSKRAKSAKIPQI